MTQHEIATALLSAAATACRWPVDAASLRSQAQRLVRSARDLGGGSYRVLLV
jgi:hypothetical protein